MTLETSSFASRQGLRNIADRTKEHSNSILEHNYFWDKSCLPATQSPDTDCHSRGCQFIPFDQYTGWQYFTNVVEFIGTWYYNHSYNNPFCSSLTGTHYYGYTELNG